MTVSHLVPLPVLGVVAVGALLGQTQLPAVPETRWEFWAVMAYLTLQSVIQVMAKLQTDRLEQQNHRIEKQTNGLIASTLHSAETIAHAAGEAKGRLDEQARVADELATANEAEARLEQTRRHESTELRVTE